MVAQGISKSRELGNIFQLASIHQASCFNDVRVACGSCLSKEKKKKKKKHLTSSTLIFSLIVKIGHVYNQCMYHKVMEVFVFDMIRAYSHFPDSWESLEVHHLCTSYSCS